MVVVVVVAGRCVEEGEEAGERRKAWIVCLGVGGWVGGWVDVVEHVMEGGGRGGWVGLWTYRQEGEEEEDAAAL